ncbi:LysR substrate-binding domain-containing protein [Roseateles koreensis]|uniref:LysR substrate-binding domain-containing protein n=1 Tax=Roseateles koreensis TaxID=2987526 RepID=A0ABT5KNY0_9BURK|nr:LysR substrate-binding domain-containing protein [Roseateles koreensis]MDC8784618.1 LysR substrate-binding domain-containing protein [Roseateles koreensis]
MNKPPPPAPAATRQRPLPIGPLRAFEAVARCLSFRAAAQELHLTQSAVSRQIQSLEEDIGCTLFLRGTRFVALSSDGALLKPAIESALQRLDQAVRQIRRARGRRVVNVTTFASFASLWLIPRLEAFQRDYPDIDIRVSAHDGLVELDDSETDVALRYTAPERVPPDAHRLFGETLTPVVSSLLAEQAAQGAIPPLRRAADLRQHTLAEEDDHRPSAEFLSWRHWLRLQGEAELQPRRWMYLNFTYQQVQAALAGQAVALARLVLVSEQLQRGDLVEPFGPAARIASPFAYWMLQSAQGQHRPEVQQFVAWVGEQAALSRQAVGEAIGG